MKPDHPKEKLLCRAIAASLLASASSISLAQSPQGATGAIEEVVVTARKKDERLQDVPLTINAMNEAMLEDAGIANLSDVADFTPGFDFAQSFGRQDFRPAIRGQSNIQGGANAGLFVDGIYVGQGGPSFPTTALERIEVVKGPQSTLYGRATLAGAINYVLKKPTETHEQAVQATAGEYGEFRTDATISGPLTESIGYMVSASHYQYDGQYENGFDGNALGAPANNDDIGGEQSQSLVGVLSFAPSDTFDGNVSLMWEESNDDPYAIALLSSSNNNCGFGPAEAPASAPGTVGAGYNNSGYYCGEVEVADILDANDGKTNLENGYFDDPGTHFEALRTNLSLNWQLGDFTLASKTGFSDYQSEARQDQTFGASDYYIVNVPFPPFGLPQRFGFLTEDRNDASEVSQEVTLSSADTGPLSYMIGTSYYGYESSGQSRNSNNGGLTATDPGYDVNPLVESADRNVSNVSVYGAIGYDFTDTLTLDAELRSSRETIEASGGSADLDFSQTYTALLPRVSVSWRTTEDLMLYSTISKGNKPGNINTTADLNDVQREVEEETAWNYEAGLKAGMLDGRATFNAAAFYIDWQDQQLTTTTSGASGFGSYSILENLGETSISGVELDFTARLTDFWDLYAGYAYTDTEIEEFRIVASEHLGSSGMLSGYEEALQLGFSADPANGDVIISGTELPQVSKHQFTLSNTIHGELNADWGWFARADYLYRSKRYAQVYNAAHTGDSAKINLRAGFESADLGLELWVNNLTDDDTSPALIRYVETTNAGIFNFGPNRAIGATLPEKRAAGVTVSYRF